MGAETKISWCDSTFNPWIGCTKVSPGCANCYAESMMHRWGKDLWGPGKPRQRTSAANWKQPLKWNKKAKGVHEAQNTWDEFCGWNGLEQTLQDLGPRPHRPRVFCGSLCDWLDSEVPIEWLADLLELIRMTPHLDWLLLTKMSELWSPRLDTVSELICGSETHQDFRSWLTSWLSGESPANVWIGCTVENQPTADKRIPELLKIPARVRFLFCEPLLELVDLTEYLGQLWHCAECGSSSFSRGSRITISAKKRAVCDVCAEDNGCEGCIISDGRGIDWVICGGESGPNARPMHPDWARSLRDQCKSAGVPFFFKQWGEWAPIGVEDARLGEDRNVGHVVDVLPSGEVFDGMDVSCNPDSEAMERVGNDRSGHMLDGVEHQDFPKAESGAQS